MNISLRERKKDFICSWIRQAHCLPRETTLRTGNTSPSASTVPALCEVILSLSTSRTCIFKAQNSSFLPSHAVERRGMERLYPEIEMFPAASGRMFHELGEVSVNSKYLSPFSWSDKWQLFNRWFSTSLALLSFPTEVGGGCVQRCTIHLYLWGSVMGGPDWGPTGKSASPKEKECACSVFIMTENHRQRLALMFFEVVGKSPKSVGKQVVVNPPAGCATDFPQLLVHGERDALAGSLHDFLQHGSADIVDRIAQFTVWCGVYNVAICCCHVGGKGQDDKVCSVQVSGWPVEMAADFQD